MSYEKQEFVDKKTKLKAAHLQHIEDGIVENEKAVDLLKESNDENKKAIAELKEQVKPSLTTKTDSGYQFTVDSAESDITVKADSSTTIYSAQKNRFPFLERVLNGGSLKGQSGVTFDKNEVTAKVAAGQTYRGLNFGPIYFPPGTYVLHREWEILSGAGTGNIGWVYIHKMDKDGTKIQGNFSAIYTSQTDVVHTFTEDTWLQFDVYANMNGTISEDAEIRLYNFSITRESAFSGFEDWTGEIVTGTSGTIPNLSPYVDIYSADKITISYKIQGNNLDEVKAQVDQNTESVKNLTGDIGAVICWGDSLTDGTGAGTSKPSSETNSDCSWPAVLGRLIRDGHAVVNAGVGGETSWMIAARQGGASIYCLPTTIPATTDKTRIYIKGEEQDYFYKNSAWTYLEGNLSYNIGTGTKSMVNPVTIAGIEGTLTSETITEGTPDADTGETVQTQVRAYYFTRSKAGEAVTFGTPKAIITNAYRTMRNYIPVIWMGQNDAPLHDGSYITQGDAINRAKQMLSIVPHDKYIIMDLPSGSNENGANRAQNFANAFGSHYINIRKFIADFGVDYANSLGANITPSDSDTSSINNGSIPSCLRTDGVHGNYWYYQIVAKAVYDKGVDLGYWE